MKRITVVVLSVLLLAACKSPSNLAKSRFNTFDNNIDKSVTAENGLVVSAHNLASKAGIYIMQRGGNAVDAAIATQFALAVVYPNAGNLGGGGFLVGRLADGREIAIDYREMAPALAHKDMYLDAAGNAVLDKSQRGHLASGVPGTVAGLFTSAKYARLSFGELVQPAIDLAEKGFIITAREASNFNSLQTDLRKNNTVMPVLVRDIPWKEGDTLRQPELAATLKRIQRNGQDGFYKGETARLVAEEMKRGGGIMTEQDLANYIAKERTPHTFQYKDYRIIGMPMPSSGGLIVNQLMKMIEKRDIAKAGFLSEEAVQLMVEAERLAYADRAEYMADADYYHVPVAALSSEKYIQDRIKNYDPSVAGSSQKIKPGIVKGYESEETTHLSVIDKAGNAISVTTTLNGSYGSMTVVGGAGFFLNNEMDDFSVKPGVPNMYGAVGNDANAIAPGKRMLSSMTPTVVLRDGKPYLVVGTPGGTTIPTSVFQTLVNILEFNMSTSDAVNKPKFHHQWLPDEIFIERGFPEEVANKLRAKGYKISSRGAIGRTEVIRVLANGQFEGVADSRGEDAAAGY